MTLRTGHAGSVGSGLVRVHRTLSPRRHYPTLHIKPYRRSPLQRLAWIFGFAAPEAGRRTS